MKRLTTPEEMDLGRRLYPTGNHFVSLPLVQDRDGSIDRVGVLHMGTAGLIEFAGVQGELGAEVLPPREPLLRPFVELGGLRLNLDSGLEWRRRSHWIPTFQYRDHATGLGVTCTVFAPVWRDAGGIQSHKGFVILFELSGPPPALTRPVFGLELTWGDLLQTVYTSRSLPARLFVRRDRWTGGPVLEPRAGSGAGPAALAVAFSAAPDEIEWSVRAGSDGESPVRLDIRARPSGSFAAFFFGVNREGDGARTVAVHLSRRGWETLLAETEEALATLHRAVDPARIPPAVASAGAAGALEERLNLNLLFNYFYALGLTIDTEELVLLTSRSPLYYVSAAFWARDALLWSFPALLMADPALAEEALGEAFGRYFRHAGIHSLYIDGRLLYPGFELDELAAYVVALWRYVRATGDSAVLTRRGLLPKIRRVLALMEAEKHPDAGIDLYRTFLLPSDDPATHPYVIYDNMMAWRALLCAADLVEAGAAAGAVDAAGGAEAAERGLGGANGLPAGLDAAALREQAARVKASIYRHGVVSGPHGPMFAWSVDLAGGYEVGDEPPGSLELLAYYGFCSRDDETWKNTACWLTSGDNPYRYREVPFPGLGCPHSRHPFVMSLFNALLGGRPERVEEATRVLVEAPLDTGLACEAFDRHTGEVKTGAAFATCAGFLAYAMNRVFGLKTGPEDFPPEPGAEERGHGR